MEDFKFNTNFSFDCEESKIPLHFKAKHVKSNNVIDFTDIIECNEVMRFDVIKGLNFIIPKANENLFIITTKAISLLDVMNYIEKEVGQISDATIFFYTLNKKSAQYATSLAKRAKTNIIISDIMNSKRDKERMITTLFDEEKINIVFCHSHAKIAAFKIGDNFFVLVGSMNAGTNARIENLNIINSEKMYNFIVHSFNVMEKEFSIKKRYE